MWTLLIIAIATTATAEVVEIPRVADVCGAAAKWYVVSACLAEHGFVTIVRDQPSAKLLRLDGPKRPGDGPALGVYLFVQSNHAWKIGGMYEWSDPYEISDFAPARSAITPDGASISISR